MKKRTLIYTPTCSITLWKSVFFSVISVRPCKEKSEPGDVSEVLHVAGLIPTPFSWQEKGMF